MRKMRDSGIDWIGTIPQDWEIVRTKSLYCSAKEIAGDRADDFERLALTLNGVIKRSKEDSVGLQPEKFSGYQILKKGELVFKLIDLENVATSRVGLSPYTGIVSPAYIVLSKQSRAKDLVVRYSMYHFLSMWQREIFNQMGDNGVRSSLNAKELLNIPHPFPSIYEQKRIVTFLDAQCAEIDAVLEKTHASIEEYKKLKQAIITQAVTKGIRGDRPMKDSGIEWIGDIPAEWSVVKGRRLILATQNGLTRRDLEKSEGFIVLKLKNLDADGNIDYSEVNRVALTDEEKSKYQLCDGDFLFVRVNGSRNLVGKCAIYHDVGEIVAYNDHIIRVKLNDLCLKEYFHYYLLSIAGKREIELHTSTAAGQFTISGDGLRELRVVFPGIVEQAETVAYLDKKSADIDALVAKKQQYLTEIENYKKSLIYEYVTGKKEVV